MRQSKRTSEVIVRVISPGSNCLKAIRQHFADLQKGQGRSLETDFFNTPVVGHQAIRELIDDWNLDLDELTCRVTHLWGERTKPTKLVHKIIFSMPAGTPPDRLLAAVRDFAEKECAPKHRYALALHTDEPHPHVHVVVRAESDYGKRLNIRKATLRKWRKAFARHLRDHGVASKATQRSTRGKARMSKLKGIYRPVRTPPLKRSGHSISRERTSKGTSSKRPQIVVSVQPCKFRDEQRQAGKGLLRYPSTLRGRVHVDAEAHRG